MGDLPLDLIDAEVGRFAIRETDDNFDRGATAEITLSASSLISHELRIGNAILLAFTGTTKVCASACACFSHINALQNLS